MTAGRIGDEVFRLPTLPGIAMRILGAMNGELASIREMEKIVSSDAALSAKILQAANSPYYSRSGSISSLGQALALLGFNEVKNLALGFSLVKAFPGRKRSAFDHVLFWKGSLVGAATAELMAKQIVPEEAENAFCIGLIQNIGSLLMANAFPERYEAVALAAAEKNAPIHGIEKELLGIDHQEVGRRLVESWGLPERIGIAIAGHHIPPDGCPPPDELGALAQILILSSLFIDRLSAPAGAASFATLARAAAAFGFSERIDLHAVTAMTAERAKQLFPLFELEFDEAAVIDLLERSKGELAALSLQLMRQIRRQSERIGELQALVSTDELTQVSNFRHLQHLLKLELERACRYGKPLAVIMADVDHFKSVNDFFGHTAGDHALKTIAAALKRTLRGSDQLARYGGEEFAVILPETALEDAVQVAERLRQAVADTTVTYRGRTINVTMSLGVAALDPERPMDAEGLLRMADEALYDAKRSGRNSVRVFGRETAPQRTDLPTILVIDDEEVVLVTVCAMLDRLGYSVMSAGQARRGLDLLSRHKDSIRMVLADMVFPDMDAAELVSTIKAESPAVKVLLSSGYPVDRRRDAPILELADGFLQKPFEMVELRAVVEKTLRD